MNDTDTDTDAMDPEMIALLRADFAPAAVAAKDRVSNRLAQTMGAAAFARLAGPAKPGVASSGSSLLGAFRVHPFGFVASFVLGTASGAAVYAAARHPVPARIVYIERPATAPSAATPSIPLVHEPGNDATSAPPVASASTVSAAPPSRALEHAGAGLAEQQALLDVARESLARGDYPATLATLSVHFRRFPKSILGEEREALEIKALAASGREAEARTRATRFKAQFPQSLLLPSLNDSVGAIP